MAILARQLCREFVHERREPGWWGFFRRTRQVITALSDLDLEIDSGEIVAYMGPNGAGKSTTVKILMGGLYPTRGTVRVCGIDPFRDRIANARQIGVFLGGRSRLAYELPIRYSFDLIRRMYRIEEGTYNQRLSIFRELMGLDEFWDLPVRKLSTGQMVRANLVAAMLHAPRVLYLDEPTMGLDVVAKARIRDFILETNRTFGTTVLLTTHDMGDVEALASRYVLIQKGRKVFDGTAGSFISRFAAIREVRLRIRHPGAAKALASAMGQTDGCLAVEPLQDGLRFVLDADRVNPLAFLNTAQQQVRVDDVVMEPVRLETVMRTLFDTSRQRRGF